MSELTSVRTTTGIEGLVDALDRLIGNGAAIVGDVVIGVGNIDLIRIDLRALIVGAVTQDETR